MSTSCNTKSRSSASAAPLCLLQITVDGDTSTNDAVLGLASGAAGGKSIKHANSEEAQQLEAAVTALLQVGHDCD